MDKVRFVQDDLKKHPFLRNPEIYEDVDKKKLFSK